MRKVIRNVDGKEIGFIADNGSLCKKVKRSRHFMRELNGWGYDTRIIEGEEFDEVKILDIETDTVYVSKKEDWLNHGIRKNFGYGDQIILPLKWHEVRDRKQMRIIE